MKRTIRKVAASSAILTTLVAALLQVSRPAEIRAHEGEECMGYYEVCAVIETETCLFWIFFCGITTQTVYYGDLYY